MLLLLGAAITASFIDSLNPSAIAQQILLQAMVKSKRQILFFISGIGLANLTMGLAIYYGSASWIVQAYSAVTTAYPVYPYGSETATSLLFLTIGIRLIVKTVRCQSNDNLEKISTPTPPAWLALLSLFFIGAAFCGVKLTSALPYLGLLAMLASYQPAFLLVRTLIL